MLGVKAGKYRHTVFPPQITPLPEGWESLPLTEMRRLETQRHHMADRSRKRGFLDTEKIQRAMVEEIRVVIARRRSEEDAEQTAAGLPLDRYPERVLKVRQGDR